jgi:glucose-6-phosphate 1-epimerase
LKPFYSIETDASGLSKVLISTPACSAEICLQGAHLTSFQPVLGEPVLFLSKRSSFTQGKAIRGGIPIIFPWFGARAANAFSDRTDGPSHGFARTSIWQFKSATMEGDEGIVTLTLDPDANSRGLGYDHFRVTYTLRLGKNLNLSLLVENLASSTLLFEEAFHTYFSVSDATKATVTGLEQTEFLDKTDGFKRKLEQSPFLLLTGETDRPYLNTTGTIFLDDPLSNRRIEIKKQNSNSTVIWNPWEAATAKLADMEPDGWRHMLCIESANVSENAVVLNARESHEMHVQISVGTRQTNTAAAGVC